MARGWNPANHPRDSNGRFKKRGTAGSAKKNRSTQTKSSSPKKLSSGSVVDGPGVSKKAGPGTVTVRASLRSATVQYGRTVPLIPGKINVYGGLLLRVEKAGDRETFLEKKKNQATEKLASKIPGGKVGDAVKDLLRSGQTQVGGVSVGKTGGRRRASSIRVSNAKKKMAGQRVRRARQPRQPRQPRKRNS